MKQMSLIEMDGFLKGKCIPRDLKVNETNAEYLVRKFGELESKLETALRECRSAGITIDNLEAKCAALAAKINVINELMEVAEQVNKLAQEETEKLAHERNTLAAENAGLKATCEDRRTFIMNGVQLGYIKVPTVDTDPALDAIRVAVSPQESTPATDDFLAEVRAMLDELEAAKKRIAELEGGAFNPAILDVVAERQRQQSVEGWTPEHDNAYQNSELADAAACYAIHAHNQGFSTPAHWPWSPDWWKQSGARRDLVKAGALILAEIERIDRAAGIGKGE